MTESRPLVRVRSLVKNYPRQRVEAPWYARLVNAGLGWTGILDDWDTLNEGLPVLKEIDLDVYADETLVILGKSGAGKSTLLHLIGALDKPNEGSILYDDVDLQSYSASALDDWRNTTVGYVFQFYHLFPDLNALENVLLPATVAYSTPAYLSKRDELHMRAQSLLEKVGLGDRAHHRPSQLSGGEQQRVAIARALILKPRLLLCDEPTGNLDQATGQTILDLLFQLKEDNGQTYVVVTHDERLAERADRVVRMRDGRILSVEKGGAAGAAPKAEEASASARLSAVQAELEDLRTKLAAAEAKLAEAPAAEKAADKAEDAPAEEAPAEEAASEA